MHSAADELAIDTDQILRDTVAARNRVDLLNRNQLSPRQEYELQRYIDGNAFVLGGGEGGDGAGGGGGGGGGRSVSNKSVSWYSNNRPRSSSPPISNIGGGDRDRYSIDNYSRLLKQKKQDAAADRDEKSRFAGYGDRPGSGIELLPVRWGGGEVIRDKRGLPHSLNVRRLYYSPIGDGVVAADGVELRRRPQQLSPRFTVTRSTTYGNDGSSGSGKYTTIDYSRSRAGAGGDQHHSDDHYSNRGASSFDQQHYSNNNSADGSQYSPTYSSDGHSSRRIGGATSDESRLSYLITNPRELIHQYATTTPISVMSSNGTDTDYYKRVTTQSEAPQRYAPFPPYHGTGGDPKAYAKQLRDEGLTMSQKAANRNAESLRPRGALPQKVFDIARGSNYNSNIDQLTETMVSSLHTSNHHRSYVH